MREVVVVGGGITGLATAYYLHQRGISVQLFEAAERLGGNIRTERHEGFLLDTGPDSWVTQKPHASRLAIELGLAARMIGTLPKAKRVYVAHKRTLEPLPDGMSLGVPTNARALWRSPLFSLAGKARMLCESLIPPRDDNADESVGAFLRRRLGDEATDVVAGPLLGGIFSGDVNEMSLAATFPQLREGERMHGSLTRAMRARAAIAGNSSTFTTLAGGMGELVTALARSLPSNAVSVNEAVHGVVRKASGYELVLDAGRVAASHVVFAGRTLMPARLLAPLSLRLARCLGAFAYESTAIVFFAMDAEGFTRELDGSGFIVPNTEAQTVRACTWVSSKWAGRAPSDASLIRTFVRGSDAKNEPDEVLVERSLKDLSDLMGIRRDKVRFTRVYRLLDASPQPTIGHLDRVATSRAIATEDMPNMHLIGQAYDGSGIPDCIRQALRTAEAIAV
jgi:protoporphyrinogen/coproporphyrinogen III oxidase